MGSLSIITIDNTTYFAQTFIKDDNFKTLTRIHLPDDLPEGKYLQIHHNPNSTLYDEENYIGKHPLEQPINFCMWDLADSPMDGNGEFIGEYWKKKRWGGDE